MSAAIKPVANTTPSSKAYLNISTILIQCGYMIGPKIGSGTYGKVRLVEHLTEKIHYAAKIIDKEKAPSDYINNFLPRELHILQSVSHDHIVAIREIVQKDRFVIIVMEYACKGDLLQFVISRGPIPETRARRMFRQMASAINHLHKHDIAHRDLKCENILLRKNLDVIIGDFGFARKVGGLKNTCDTFCGSTAYASPQLVEGIPYNPRMNDVWSLGCILYIMVCGTMPFDDSNVKKMLAKQKAGVTFVTQMDANLNPKVKKLIRRLLDPDQDRRVCLEDALQSDWMVNKPTKSLCRS